MSRALQLQTCPEGILLPIKAHAAARENAVRGIQDGRLRVHVTQAPEKGKANKAIQQLLAKKLGLRKSQVELVQGETSPLKTFLVRDVSQETLEERIATQLAQSE